MDSSNTEPEPQNDLLETGTDFEENVIHKGRLYQEMQPRPQIL